MNWFARALGAICLVCAGVAHAGNVADVEILFPPIAGYEEYCASEEALAAVERGTHPGSKLITCFADYDEWAKGQGTMMFKAEIVRQYLGRTFTEAEFKGVLAQMDKDVGMVNLDTLRRDGQATSGENAAIA